MEHPPAARSNDYDAELQRHNEVLRRVADVQSHDDVLDVGCGTGQTTRQAAQAARSGRVLGVDVSAAAIRRARHLARASGIHNVTFEHADAQVHRFPPRHFDLAISRFGTMFFDDPQVAFANIGRALQPGGRLVTMVWQSRERNEWAVAIRRALEAAPGPALADRGGPDAFSLGNPGTVRQILEVAGFADVCFTDVEEPVYYGRDVADALDWVRGFTTTSDVLSRLDPVESARAEDRLQVMLGAHHREDGVWIGSRAWIVTASLRPARAS